MCRGKPAPEERTAEEGQSHCTLRVMAWPHPARGERACEPGVAETPCGYLSADLTGDMTQSQSSGGRESPGDRGSNTAALCLEQHSQSSSLKKLQSVGRMLLRALRGRWDLGRLKAGCTGSPRLHPSLWRPLPIISEAVSRVLQIFGVSSGVFHRISC